MITFNSPDIRKLERDLKKFNARAIPFANKSALNNAAFMARVFAQDEIRQTMIIRNAWTLRSVQVEKAAGLDIRKQFSVVGSRLPYMEKQEFGGSKSKAGVRGIPLTTSWASGEGRGKKPRRKLARGPNKLKAVALRKQAKRIPGKRGQRNLVIVKMAAAGTQKFVYMDLGNREGIFKVTGRRSNIKVQMVHDMTHGRVSIPPNPWLAPAVRRVIPRMPALYRSALEFQAARLNLF